jgi:hypothetical protein
LSTAGDALTPSAYQAGTRKRLGIASDSYRSDWFFDTRASTSVFCTRVLPLVGTTFTGPHQNQAIIQDPKSTFSQFVEHFGKQKELFIPITPIKIATEFLKNSINPPPSSK